MPFNPNFTITPTLANLLVQAGVLREKILRLPILPKREVGLVRSARLRMIHSSTAIEGNPLKLKEVGEVLAGKIVAGIQEKDRLEVVNYEKALEFIDAVFEKRTKISEKIILKIHQIITDKILPKEESGHYRKGQVYIVKKPTNEVVYKPPKASRVPSLMKELIVWLNNQETSPLSPILEAAITHHQTVTIHPFTDGNGRIARALATLILYLRGYDIKKMFALEDYYNLDRSTYYQMIDQARRKNDLTGFLKYFTLGLVQEMQEVLQKVERFSLAQKIDQKAPVYLTKRQREILDYVSINGRVSRSEVVKNLEISARTAHRDLDSLVKLGLLERAGKGPATFYILVK